MSLQTANLFSSTFFLLRQADVLIPRSGKIANAEGEYLLHGQIDGAGSDGAERPAVDGTRVELSGPVKRAVKRRKGVLSRDPQEGKEIAGERRAGRCTLVITTMMTEPDATTTGADGSSDGGESSCQAFQHLISIAHGEAGSDGMPSPTIHLQHDHRPRQYQVTSRT